MILDLWTWWTKEWTWWTREIIDLWAWFKWRVIWVVQRLTRHLMLRRGLKSGFRFGPIRVDEVEWYEWGNRLLEPQIEYYDGKSDHVVNWKRFSWLSWEEFLSSCVMYDIGLPENCVWVCDEREVDEMKEIFPVSKDAGNYPPAGCQGPVVGVYDERELLEPKKATDWFLVRAWKNLWSKPKPLPPKVQETEPLKGFAVHSVDLVGIDGEDFVIAIITDGKDWIQACFPENCVWVCDEREAD